jgi:hypothetical protein
MEDFVQILVIILFIIISIASSKKKKSKQQTFTKPKVSPNRQNVNFNRKAVTQNNKSNILEELFGLKLPEMEPQNTEVPNYKSTPAYNSYQKLSADAEAEYERENEDGVSDYYEKETKEIFDRNSEKEKHQAFKTRTVENIEEQINSKIHKIFSDRSDFKNYIIIQELLNKPKALRR